MIYLLMIIALLILGFRFRTRLRIGSNNSLISFCEYKINSSIDFISFYNFISNHSSSNNLDKEIQNAFRLSQLILDVLNPVLQDWIQNNYSQYTTSIWDDILNINNPHLNNVKEIIRKYRLENNQQNPNDFKLFDITGCVSIAINVIFKIRKQKITEYSQINDDISNLSFTQADAFNFSRLIRNYFYGHNIGFKVNNQEYIKLIGQLESIFAKLSIDHSKKTLKNEIKSTLITKASIGENDFIKWFEQKRDALKLERKVVFRNDERIEDQHLSIEATFY